MPTILLKYGCLVTLNGKEMKTPKTEGEVFAEKDELTMTNIYLALNKVV